MGSYKLTWHGGGGVCSACGELQAPGHGVGGVCVELRSDVARRGRCLCGVKSWRGPAWAVWAMFVWSYQLTWHGVSGVCGELQTDVARCGWCLWGVTS